MDRTDHPQGIARGTIEETAWERLHDIRFDAPETAVHAVMLYSIAISLKRIADAHE